MTKLRSNYMYLEYVLVIFIVAFLYSLYRYGMVFNDLYNLVMARGILVTDYITVSGLSATLLNCIIVIVVNFILLKKNEIKISGAIFAGIYTVLGFSFFGKSFINIIPIYFGVYLYSRSTKTGFSRYYVVALFASGLAPLVSLGFSSILMALFSSILGVGYGFLIPIFSNQAIRFHGGYTLYNIGFAGGVFAIIIYSIIKFFGFEYPLETQISESHTTELLIILFLISTVYLLAGLTNMKTGKVSTLKKLYSLSGRAVSDFTSILSKEVTYLNIGILGYFLIAIFLITQVEVTGIIAGGFLTVIGFGAFGKHLKNIIPIICGIFLAGYYAQGEINESVMVIALFGTCLAPIAGDFGFFAGLIAGGMHYTLVQNTSEWQGGINLYNNGFAAGFVAAILSSIFDKLDLKVMVKNIFKSS